MECNSRRVRRSSLNNPNLISRPPADVTGDQPTWGEAHVKLSNGKWDHTTRDISYIFTEMYGERRGKARRPRSRNIFPLDK